MPPMNNIIIILVPAPVCGMVADATSICLEGGAAISTRTGLPKTLSMFKSNERGFETPVAVSGTGFFTVTLNVCVTDFPAPILSEGHDIDVPLTPPLPLSLIAAYSRMSARSSVVIKSPAAPPVFFVVKEYWIMSPPLALGPLVASVFWVRLSAVFELTKAGGISATLTINWQAGPVLMAPVEPLTVTVAVNASDVL